jgi:organic radical activating enzyme
MIKKETIMGKQYIDHADIVTTHTCNNKCTFCIDKFVNTDDRIVSLEDVDKFLKMLRKTTNKKLDVLLLGGEPTTLPTEHLIEIANLIHKYGFEVAMSTNGINKDKIIEILPYFDWIQVTVHSDAQIDYWRKWPDKINIKWSGDKLFTMEKLQHFVEYTEGFSRRSVSMYFTPNWEELCTDKEVWELLDTLDWVRNGSYNYAFYKGVRFKKCIHGETNLIDEPTIPKLYPNGNYNKTWCNEELDDYLSNCEW